MKKEIETIIRTDRGYFRLRIIQVLEPVAPAEIGDVYYDVIDIIKGRVVGMMGPNGEFGDSPDGLLQVLEPVS